MSHAAYHARRKAAALPMWRAVAEVLADTGGRRSMGEAAREYAAARPFSASAARLAEWLKEGHQARGGRVRA